MKCFDCEESARGVCASCGVAMCAEHGNLMIGEESLPTENSLQQVQVPKRLFVCEFDRKALALGA